MKRTITLMSLLVSTMSFAQLPTITAANQMPSFGDTIFYSDANAFGFDPDGSGGAIDVIWDYSALNPTASIDFMFVDPTGTPETANYAAATIAMANSITPGYEYFENTASTISRWGYSSLTVPSLYYNNSFVRYSFPITPGVLQSDTYTGTMGSFGAGEDSATIAMGNYSFIGDQYGTLSLPPLIFGGAPEVFDSVIRVHVTETFQIQLWLSGTPIITINVSDDYYFWFDEETQEPVLIYGVTTDDSGGPPQEVLRYQSAIAGTGTGGAAPTIATTNDVTPTTWCESTATNITVNFVVTGTVNGGNTYTVEMSDAAGSFASPLSIGTLASSASGNLTINAVAPGSLAAGTGYRVRVIASDPSTTGSDNTTNLVVDPCASIYEVNSEAVILYPNPTENAFTVEIETLVEEVLIMDMNGRIVKSFGNQSVYEISELTSGMYMVHITTDGTQLVKRVLLR